MTHLLGNCFDPKWRDEILWSVLQHRALDILPLSESWIVLSPSQAKVSSPTETERCIESLIAVFQKHAGRDGNNSKLSKAEFMIFMNSELGAFTKVVVPAPNPRLQDQDRRLAQNEWQQLSPQGWVSSEWLLSIFSFSFFWITCDLKIRVIKLYMT